MAKRYYENVIYNNDEILKAVNYYSFAKTAIQGFGMPTWETVEEFLPDTITDEEKEIIHHRYNIIHQTFGECQAMGINCCDLVEYIGNYPTNYPYPNMRKINPKLEKLMQDYDIMPIYYTWDDIDGLQINGDDIKRISSTLDRSIRTLVDVSTRANDVFRYQYPLDEEEYVKQIRSRIAFPASAYQERGKTFRKECQAMLERGNRKEKQ